MNRFVAPLIFTVALVTSFLVAISATSSDSQTGARAHFDLSSNFVFADEPPRGFAEVAHIYLEADGTAARGELVVENRRLPLTGVVLGGRALSFAATRAGVVYEFTGRFTEGGVYSERYDAGSERRVLTGTSIKRRGRRVLAQTQVGDALRARRLTSTSDDKRTLKNIYVTWIWAVSVAPVHSDLVLI